MCNKLAIDNNKMKSIVNTIGTYYIYADRQDHKILNMYRKRFYFFKTEMNKWENERRKNPKQNKKLLKIINNKR